MPVNDGSGYWRYPLSGAMLSGGQKSATGVSSAVVKAGAGDLLGIFTASSNAGVYTLFDSAAPTVTTNQLTTTFVAILGWQALPIPFNTGLLVSSSGASWTVSYN